MVDSPCKAHGHAEHALSRRHHSYRKRALQFAPTPCSRKTKQRKAMLNVRHNYMNIWYTTQYEYTRNHNLILFLTHDNFKNQWTRVTRPLLIIGFNSLLVYKILNEKMPFVNNILINWYKFGIIIIQLDSILCIALSPPFSLRMCYKICYENLGVRIDRLIN